MLTKGPTQMKVCPRRTLFNPLDYPKRLDGESQLIESAISQSLYRRIYPARDTHPYLLAT